MFILITLVQAGMYFKLHTSVTDNLLTLHEDKNSLKQTMYVNTLYRTTPITNVSENLAIIQSTENSSLTKTEKYKILIILISS